jgi:AcrR family transcriptional regulator
MVDASGSQVGPLYKRLPHGPHKLGPREVSLHQRARLHGAMIEAVSSTGYRDVTVKQVIGLAGVSRRSFYEQFSDKEACFLATFDVVARRVIDSSRRAYREAHGRSERRLAAAFTALAGQACADRRALLLVLQDSLTAGASGALRLRGAAAAGERLLAVALRRTPGAASLPAPVLRGIVGGLQGELAARLGEQAALDEEDLAAELTAWTLAQRPPARGASAERLQTLLHERMHSAARTIGAAPAPPAVGGERRRLLESALRQATAREGGVLSAVEIADAAGLPLDAFLELFPDGERCLQAALAETAKGLLELTARACEPAAPGPQAIRLALSRLLGHLATHPAHALLLTGAAGLSVEGAGTHGPGLAEALAATLPFGPEASGLHRRAAAGAIVHTVRYHAGDARTRLLPAVADHLTYVALAPTIGAHRALEVLSRPC